MDFISASPAAAVSALLLIGFSVGVCSSFFGVGGAFIVTPALNILGFPMVYAIGTDLAHMAGKSVVATLRHRRLGHVDMRAAGLLIVGTLPGVSMGTRAVHYLESLGRTDSVLRFTYIALLLVLGSLMLRESIKNKGAGNADRFGPAVRLPLPPFISLPRSGIGRISIWTVIGIGLLTGFLAGFLGVGGGFIRMPALIYLLGMPARVAVGTDLVEVLFSGAYGSYLYGRSGHVDLVAALVMLVGASLGSQIGATATQYVDGKGIRKLFAVTILGAGAAVVMKQMGLNIAAAIMLFGLAAGMTIIIVRSLVISLRAAGNTDESERKAGLEEILIS